MLNILQNPTVFAAIISGLVALIISGVSGAYTFHQNRIALENIRAETTVERLASARTERFLEAHDAYLVAYSEFEGQFRSTQDNERGFVDRLNLITGLYASHSRNLVDRYEDFLPQQIVHSKIGLQEMIDRQATDPSVANAQQFHEAGLRFHENLSRALVNK